MGPFYALKTPRGGSLLHAHFHVPFGGPAAVLRYLARYTHRVAISNARLVSLEGGRVCFRYKDYARRSRERTMTLDAEEFLRRF